jgi:hypothetical protein
MDPVPEMDPPPPPPPPPPIVEEVAQPDPESLFGNSDEVTAANGTNVTVAIFDPQSEKEESKYRWPAVMDSILAAPIRIKATKVEVPLYSE